MINEILSHIGTVISGLPHWFKTKNTTTKPVTVPIVQCTEIRPLNRNKLNCIVTITVKNLDNKVLNTEVESIITALWAYKNVDLSSVIMFTGTDGHYAELTYTVPITVSPSTNDPSLPILISVAIHPTITN